MNYYYGGLLFIKQVMIYNIFKITKNYKITISYISIYFIIKVFIN